MLAEIRSAESADAKSISSLILQLAPYCYAEPSGKGAERFLARISEKAITEFIGDPAYYYIVALHQGVVVGAASMRNAKHLYHFFVTPQFHRQGIGKALWQNLQIYSAALGNQGRYTVNSSTYAIPVYRQLGFAVSGEQQTANGVTFQPMELRT